MRNLTQHDITQAVIARFDATPDPRLKEIMTSLVQHLHAFAREVKLTQEEWFRGIDFLTRVGRITDEQRQEFILLSDVLGVSMLVDAMNNDRPAGCTEATVLGPFHVAGAPQYEHGQDLAAGARGQRCEVRATVRGIDGEPVPNALIDVWQADGEGKYDVQRPDRRQYQARGVLRSGPNGEFHFWSVLPESYPIPDDGPVGEMLRATGRHPWRPAHLHFMIEAPGYETLVTHVFRRGDAYLDSDAVFGVRESLVADWVEQSDGSWRVEYDFVLSPQRN